MRVDMICGIEFELEYNAKLLGTISHSDHHSSIPTWLSNSFIAEQDGSLEVCHFNDGKVVEIISIPFLLSDYRTILKAFEDLIYSMTANKLNTVKSAVKSRYNLYDLICFNDTTGAHIHLSVLKPSKEKTLIQFKDKFIAFDGKLVPINSLANYGFLGNFTEKLKAKVMQDLPSIYPSWSISLYRGAASRITPVMNYRERYLEWNLTGQGECLEYRSFHLRGIETWKDFYKIWDDLFSLINTHIKEELSKTRPLASDEPDVDVIAIPLTKNSNYEEMEFIRCKKSYSYGLQGVPLKQRRRLHVNVQDHSKSMEYCENIQ